METKLTVPDISENIKSGQVVAVLAAEGDTVRKDQSLLELETEKAAVEIPSPHSGLIKKIFVKPGDTVEVGQVFMLLETDQTAAADEKVAGAEAPAEKKREEEARDAANKKPTGVSAERPRQETIVSESPIPASPSVRKLAREIGVDLSRIKGSGPRGRISLEDVKNQAKVLLASRPAAMTESDSPSLPDFSQWGAVRREAMSSVRRITAERMALSARLVAQVTQYHEADLGAVEEFIKANAARAAQAGGKLTVTSVLVKLAARALKKYPRFNASLDMAQKTIIYKDYVHIGVAVDSDRGLLVPVLRHADKKDISAIARELADLAERTRNKKITPDELEGGTFTISNLGSIGGTHFQPLVFWPQAAILGVSRARKQAVFGEKGFEPRSMLPLSLSYDHRLIDGADGIRFLQYLVTMIERPLAALLEGEGDR